MRYRNIALDDTDHEADARAERREFGRLLLVVALLVLGLAFALDRLAVWVAPRLPFSWEKEVAHTLHMDTLPATALGGIQAGKCNQQIEAALQQHLDRIARVVDLPPEMSVTAHYVDSPTVNAMATLGGNITVYSGLLHQIEYEQELDAVLAHELGHVQHRDMVRQISRGLTTAVALSLLGIRSPTLNRWLIGDLQRLELLAYSRDAERQADATARKPCSSCTAIQVDWNGCSGASKHWKRNTAAQPARGRPSSNLTRRPSNDNALRVRPAPRHHSP